MKNKKINIMVIIALLLVVSFFASGNDPVQQEKLSSNNVQMTVDNNNEEQPTDKEVNSQSSTEKAVELNLPDESENRDIEKDQYSTDPVPEGKPKPVEWQETNIIEEKESHVILSVNCSTILDNIENLDP
ncbi:MAG: hypothetical protein MJA31_09575, partial [Clostridia bacterium]|nr:hypothetical protein [Clostridia bacterium]